MKMLKWNSNAKCKKKKVLRKICWKEILWKYHNEAKKKCQIKIFYVKFSFYMFMADLRRKKENVRETMIFLPGKDLTADGHPNWK